jgi:hemoglobin
VRAVVEAFYDRIEAESPTLRDMLPRDTSGSRQKLFEFLSGWLGGPNLYWERRGHPRLRMRHMPFRIGTPEADEWARCMDLAIDDAAIADPAGPWMAVRLREVAIGLRNQPDPGVIVPTSS